MIGEGTVVHARPERVGLNITLGVRVTRGRTKLRAPVATASVSQASYISMSFFRDDRVSLTLCSLPPASPARLLPICLCLPDVPHLG